MPQTTARTVPPVPRAAPAAGADGAAAPARRAWPVSTIVERADQILREQTRPVWVRGEVSGWKRARTGHCYFTLKDGRAELPCVLFDGDARRLPALPEDGMEVDVFGELGIFAARGRFQMRVSDLDRTGMGGMWQEAKDRLVAQLRAEGLLDEARKRPLPAVPECVGIVTAAQSAAWHDMWRILRRKAWWIRVQIADCRVEGPHAAQAIAEAIRRFGSTRDGCAADVVLVARGGGSAESLWGFNLEPVARAIAACPVPVISAVGHETDFTVADLVADVRAATPTAGAENAVPDGGELLDALRRVPQEMQRRVVRSLGEHEQRLARERRDLHHGARRRVHAVGVRLDALNRHLEARSPRQQLRGAAERLDRERGGLDAAMHRRLRALHAEADASDRALHAAAAARLQALQQRFGAALEGIEARSPLRVLQRGYAVVRRPDTGAVLRDSADAAPGEPLRVRLARGALDVRVERTLPDDPSTSSNPEHA